MAGMAASGGSDDEQHAPTRAGKQQEALLRDDERQRRASRGGGKPPNPTFANAPAYTPQKREPPAGPARPAQARARVPFDPALAMMRGGESGGGRRGESRAHEAAAGEFSDTVRKEFTARREPEKKFGAEYVEFGAGKFLPADDKGRYAASGGRDATRAAVRPECALEARLDSLAVLCNHTHQLVHDLHLAARVGHAADKHAGEECAAPAQTRPREPMQPSPSAASSEGTEAIADGGAERDAGREECDVTPPRMLVRPPEPQSGEESPESRPLGPGGELERELAEARAALVDERVRHSHTAQTLSDERRAGVAAEKLVFSVPLASKAARHGAAAVFSGEFTALASSDGSDGYDTDCNCCGEVAAAAVLAGAEGSTTSGEALDMLLCRGARAPKDTRTAAAPASEVWQPRAWQRCEAAGSCAVLHIRGIVIPAVHALTGVLQSLLAVLIVLAVVASACGYEPMKGALSSAAALASSRWSGAAVLAAACVAASSCVPVLGTAVALRGACLALPSLTLGGGLWAVYHALWLAGSMLAGLVHVLRERRMAVLVACCVAHAVLGWQPLLEARREGSLGVSAWRPLSLANGTPTGQPHELAYVSRLEPTAWRSAAVGVEPLLNVLPMCGAASGEVLACGDGGGDGQDGDRMGK